VGPGHDSPQPRVTTLGQQQHLTPPCGWLRGRHMSRESDILQGINSESGPPWESVGPVPDPYIYGLGLQVWLSPGPPRVRTGPLEWDPDRPLWDPGGGPEPTRVQTWSGSNRTYLHTLLLPAQAEIRCCHVA
jgi:hypothetical protein